MQFIIDYVAFPFGVGCLMAVGGIIGYGYRERKTKGPGIHVKVNRVGLIQTSVEIVKVWPEDVRDLVVGDLAREIVENSIALRRSSTPEGMRICIEDLVVMMDAQGYMKDDGPTHGRLHLQVSNERVLNLDIEAKGMDE